MIFGKKKKIAIQIEDSSINIVVGNKGNIISSKVIELPNGVCEDGNISRVEVVTNLIDDYLEDNKISTKNISFVLSGSDIITRYIEVPILKDKALREALEYEVSQFIPNIENYYMDYEIIEKINTEEKKAYKVLLVAVPKVKVDILVEACERLERELDVVDIVSNCLARVIKSSSYFSKGNAIGVFLLGKNTSTFTIIEDEISKLERILPFGVNNILGELEGVKRSELDINILLENDMRLQLRFENLLSTISNTLRYYNSQWGNNFVTKFLIICEYKDIAGIDKYMEKYFTIPCELIKEPSDLGLKIKVEDNFSKYVATYGLFLRRD